MTPLPLSLFPLQSSLFSLSLHLHLTGILLLALFLLNLLLPQKFHWKSDLQNLSPINQQIFISHALFIALTVLLMAILTLVYTPLLLDRSPLSTILLFGLSTFWLLKLLTHLLLTSPKLWRNNPFNLTMHILFSLLWLYLTATYTAALLHSLPPSHS